MTDSSHKSNQVLNPFYSFDTLMYGKDPAKTELYKLYIFRERRNCKARLAVLTIISIYKTNVIVFLYINWQIKMHIRTESFTKSSIYFQDKRPIP